MIFLIFLRCIADIAGMPLCNFSCIYIRCWVQTYRQIVQLTSFKPPLF